MFNFIFNFRPDAEKLAYYKTFGNFTKTYLFYSDA